MEEEEEEGGFLLVAAAAPPDADFAAEIRDEIEKSRDSLWTLNKLIHDNPELGFREYEAHEALTAFFGAREGWRVTPSAYGMDTAWVASNDAGRAGPVVSFNVEMDALPGLGHACGHNLIATASVAAGLATAAIMHRRHLSGKVLVFGTPAEEGGGGGKILLLERGAYSGVDVSLVSHPGILHNSAMVRTSAFARLEATFHGTAAHAANSPWLGVNALDALVVAYTAVSALRQQTMPDDVIEVMVTDAGSPTPSVIHAHAGAVFVVRSATSARLAALRDKVEACVRAGAMATGARAEIRAVRGYSDHVPNSVLAGSYNKYWTMMPDAPNDPPLPPPGQFTWVKASTDQGDLSHAMPSINASFAIPPGPAGGQPHSQDFEWASGTEGAFDKALKVAVALAGTAMDVSATPGLLDKVKEQWRQDISTRGEALPGFK